jgi:hypothetical protein
MNGFMTALMHLLLSSQINTLSLIWKNNLKSKQTRSTSGLQLTLAQRLTMTIGLLCTYLHLLKTTPCSSFGEKAIQDPKQEAHHQVAQRLSATSGEHQQPTDKILQKSEFFKNPSISVAIFKNWGENSQHSSFVHKKLAWAAAHYRILSGSTVWYFPNSRSKFSSSSSSSSFPPPPLTAAAAAALVAVVVPCCCCIVTGFKSISSSLLRGLTDWLTDFPFT